MQSIGSRGKDLLNLQDLDCNPNLRAIKGCRFYFSREPKK